MATNPLIALLFGLYWAGWGLGSPQFLSFLSDEFTTLRFRPPKHPVDIAGDDLTFNDEHFLISFGSKVDTTQLCDDPTVERAYGFFMRKPTPFPNSQQKFHGFEQLLFRHNLPSRNVLKRLDREEDKAVDLAIQSKGTCSHFITDTSFGDKDFMELHTKPEYQQIVIQLRTATDRKPIFFHFTCSYYKSESAVWTISNENPSVFIYSERPCIYRFEALELMSSLNYLAAGLLLVLGLGLGAAGNLLLRKWPLVFKVALLFTIGCVISLMMNELNFERADTTLWIFASFLIITLVFLNIVMFENGFLLILCGFIRHFRWVPRFSVRGTDRF